MEVVDIRFRRACGVTFIERSSLTKSSASPRSACLNHPCAVGVAPGPVNHPNPSAAFRETFTWPARSAFNLSPFSLARRARGEQSDHQLILFICERKGV